MTLNENAEGRFEDTERIPDNMTYSRALQWNFDLGRSPAPPTPAKPKLLTQDSGNAQQSSFIGETDLSGGDSELDIPAAEASKNDTSQRALNEDSVSSSAVSLAFMFTNPCTLIKYLALADAVQLSQT